MLELCNVVVVDGAQKLVLEIGVGVVVFAEDANLLSVPSVGICYDRASGFSRMDRVDMGSGHNSKHDSSVAHCLVLRVADGEYQMSQLPISAVQIDGSGVGVELNFCGLDRFVGQIGVWNVHAANVGVREQHLVGV